MWRWPMLDPALLERLALSLDDLDAMLRSFLSQWPPNDADDAFVDRALSYPWVRPSGSFILEPDGRTSPATAERHAELAARMTGEQSFTAGSAEEPRWPLLAVGSNGAPDTLVRKLAHLPPPDRRVMAIAGTLHDFDIGPAARLTPYGAFPSTPFPSPGTRVASSVLWVTQAALEALAWTELSYGLGRLTEMTFEPHAAEPRSTAPDSALVFVSRWGHLGIDGAPIALEAIDATNRVATPWSQERLLRDAATRVMAASATHLDLLRAVADDPGPILDAVRDAVVADALPFDANAFEPFPGSAEVA